MLACKRLKKRFGRFDCAVLLHHIPPHFGTFRTNHEPGAAASPQIAVPSQNKP
jgi:hypothetical protein